MVHVELKGVRKSFGAVDVIRGADLTIANGEFLVLVGPSGCGKSTLLRCIAGLERISAGKLLIDGRDMTTAEPVQRGAAMVFQSYALYPHMTVAENIGFGLKIARMDKEAIRKRVVEVAELLKLDQLLDRKPKALSGGQRQRVAIGRALARKPRIFLFDEPLSNLDASLRAEMRVELAKLHAALGNTMIYVTHDQVEAMTLANRMVVMRAGIIEQVGSPLELFNHPANKFVAGFLGQPPMNFIKVAARRSPTGRLEIPLAGGVLAFDAPPALGNGDLELGVRPEDLILDGQGLLEARVELVEHLGGETIVYGRTLDGQALIVKIPGQSTILAQDVAAFALFPDRIHIFGQDGANLGAVNARIVPEHVSCSDSNGPYPVR